MRHAAGCWICRTTTTWPAAARIAPTSPMNGWTVERQRLATATVLALLSPALADAAELDLGPLFLSCPIKSFGKKTRLRATPMPFSMATRIKARSLYRVGQVACGPYEPAALSSQDSFITGSRGLGGLALGPNSIPKPWCRSRPVVLSRIWQARSSRWRATPCWKSSAKAPPNRLLPNKNRSNNADVTGRHVEVAGKKAKWSAAAIDRMIAPVNLKGVCDADRSLILQPLH